MNYEVKLLETPLTICLIKSNSQLTVNNTFVLYDNKFWRSRHAIGNCLRMKYDSRVVIYDRLFSNFYRHLAIFSGHAELVKLSSKPFPVVFTSSHQTALFLEIST